jgi:hypothetical protein
MEYRAGWMVCTAVGVDVNSAVGYLLVEVVGKAKGRIKEKEKKGLENVEWAKHKAATQKVWYLLNYRSRKGHGKEVRGRMKAYNNQVCQNASAEEI